MKRIFSFFFTLSIAIVLFAGVVPENSWSDTKNPAVTIKKNQSVKTQAVAMVKKTDPYPSNIYAFECPCKTSVEPAGGILMKGVIVRLRNIKCPGMPKTNPVNGRVKFTWYDLKDKRFKYVTKSFTNLQTELNVTMLPPTQTILASKSSLLVAEITKISGAKDCNLSNNRIRIATCVLEPVY